MFGAGPAAFVTNIKARRDSKSNRTVRNRTRSRASTAQLRVHFPTEVPVWTLATIIRTAELYQGIVPGPGFVVSFAPPCSGPSKGSYCAHDADLGGGLFGHPKPPSTIPP